MKKSLTAILLILTLLFCACGDDTSDINSALTGLAEDMLTGNSQSENTSSSETPPPAELSPEELLVQHLGEAYFEGKAISRVEDEEIFGEMCAVFRFGVNTDEKFTTEGWFAVSPSAKVYTFDFETGLWVEYVEIIVPPVPDDVTVDNCLYALNEIVGSEYSAEYYDADDEVWHAVYASEDAYDYGEDPVMMVKEGDPFPEGYYHGSEEFSYFSVYNFTTIQEIANHFRLYFTDEYVAEMQEALDFHFMELHGSLYLRRGGMNYGTISIDFDSIDTSMMYGNMLMVDVLLYGDSPYMPMYVEFAEEDSTYKIANAEYFLQYNLYRVSDDLTYAEVPDFSAFVNGAASATDETLFEYNEATGTYSITHLGDYYEDLPRYANLLKAFGYESLLEGYESSYMFEKYEEEVIVSVNVYALNEQDGVLIEVSTSAY